MVKSVVREHKWTPQVINSLYLDDTDYFGLEWWYNDVCKVNEEMKSKNKKV